MSRPSRLLAPPRSETETDVAPRRRAVESGVPDGIWAALTVLLAGWVALRLGLLDLWGSVPFEGGAVRLPNGFAGVDHPFHAARADTLRRALADGEILRWIGHHQGGYPVEFYPLGVAWLEVGLWALLLGSLPMVAVHKLAVGLIFLLPGLAFALMARRDGWPLGLALVAFAAHAAVPGDWEHGGYTELVQWGLVTNVAAAVALLFVLVWLTAFLDEGRPRHAAGAALAAAFAVCTNPRSLIALGVVGIGVWLTAGGRVSLARRTARLAAVGAATALLAAPELVSLLRFSHLYEFVRYEAYAGAGDYLGSAVQAVSPPVFAFGIAGLLAACWLPGRSVTRTAAVTLFLYAGVTLLIAGLGDDSPVPQLEATRLMPFQRLLTIYLAAVALQLGARWLGQRAGGRRIRLADVAPVAGAAALLLAFVAPAGGAVPEPAVPPAPTRGLYPVVDTVAPEQADFRAAIEAADAAAPPGTAILVLGSALSWHQRLWAPLWSDRPFFYDNWLWYWQPRHAGPFGYAFEDGHDYPYPALALDADYLDRHGIGAVAVTATRDDALAEAARSSALEPVRSGVYDVYAVREPTTVVTLAGGDAATSGVGNQQIVATGVSEGGEATIRRNWFPRWRATVNGEEAAISRTDDGYMSVPVPAGEVRIELTYAVDALDRLARVGTLLGILGLAGAIAAPRVRRREPSAPRAP